MTDIHDEEKCTKRIIYREESTKFECPYYNEYMNIIKRFDKNISKLSSIEYIEHLLKGMIDIQKDLEWRYWYCCENRCQPNQIEILLDIYINYLDIMEKRYE